MSMSKLLKHSKNYTNISPGSLCQNAKDEPADNMANSIFYFGKKRRY